MTLKSVIWYNQVNIVLLVWIYLIQYFLAMHETVQLCVILRDVYGGTRDCVDHLYIILYYIISLFFLHVSACWSHYDFNLMGHFFQILISSEAIL